jgi:hypothetical protein
MSGLHVALKPAHFAGSIAVLGLALVSGCQGDVVGQSCPTCGGTDAAASVGGSGTTPGAAGTGNVGVGGSTNPQGTPHGVEGIGWSTRYPRLSHAQWENSVRDLLKLDALPGLAESFSLDPDDSSFDTYAVRTVSANLWLDYQRAAETIAASVAGDAAKLAKAVSAPALADAKTFVIELGGRAFRRPLTDAEIASHVALFEKAPELFEGGDAFARGAELVIRALLQSPHFLYRVESSTAVTDHKIWLSGHEVASRLSYALWNTAPSNELLAAAMAGELATADGVTKWTKSMLTDARAKEALVGFHTQLFDVANYGSIAKNATRFPTFTAELAPTLQDEARLFFEEITVTRGGSVAALLTTPVAFVNATTAPFYGLNAANYGATLTKADLDPARRAGVLTQVGFLSKYGSQSQSDPILRGVHISLDVLCSALPAPPNNIPPLPEQQPNQTNRQRVETLTSVAPCSSCHNTFINPLGFAFESYDAIGQWRDTDNGQPINAAASYDLDGAKVTYDGAVQLSALLAKSPSVHRCYSEHWLEYAMGRRPTDEEQGVIDNLSAASLQSDSIASLLSSITTLETFRARPEETP